MNTGEEAALRLKRLRFRSWRRGFREADLILGRFADERLESLDEAGLAAFERLLDQPDPDIYDWIVGRRPPPPEHDTEVLAQLREFRERAAAPGDR